MLPLSQVAMATALHVTSCQDEFRQQQMAVLWRASGATHTQVTAHSHTHRQSCMALCSYFYLLFSVSAETSGVWACEDSWFSPHCCTVPTVRNITFFVCGCVSCLFSPFLSRFSVFPLPPLALHSFSTKQMFIITKDTLTRIFLAL